MAKLTTSNVRAEINRIAGASRSVRDDIQRVLNFAAKYAVAEQNPLYFTVLRDAMEKRTGVSTAKLHGYILSSVSNLTYAENKNGKMIYRAKTKGETMQHTETVKCWVDWKREDAPVTEYDMKKFYRMLESKASPKEGVLVSEDVQELAKHFLAEINALVEDKKIAA